MAMRRSAAVVSMVAGALLLVVAVTAAISSRDAQPAAGPTGTVGPDASTGIDELSTAIAKAQATLRENPGDYRTWAELGAAYVEQARIVADPSYYPKAQGALEKSLSLNQADNDLARTGMGALANARHQFAQGADWARQAQAINAAGSTSFGVLADSLVQLGDYDGATAAVQQMLDLKPGIPSFTRASYDLELHGNIDGARSALNVALSNAYRPSDISYCRTYLGALSFSQGDLDGAAEQFRIGLEQTPGEPTLLIGQARVDAARGDVDAAAAGYQQVVDVRPLPDYLVEFGEYLQSVGRTDKADQQYALFRTTQKLFAANGVQDTLTVALVDANHGDPADAVAAGEAEYAARQNVDAADALGWALHSAGRDAEALPYAQKATGMGGRNAMFIYHRGVIEQAVGMTEQARASLDSALTINPHFSPLYAPAAADALAALGGPL